jgi:CRP-like cAMP-binding protein
LSIIKGARVTNRLIAGIPTKDRVRLLANCEPVDLVFGDILSEADQPIEHVYFPLAGFVSLVATLDGHQPLEMGLVGNEGVLGVTLKLGIKTAPMRAVVQGTGTALRMTESKFMRYFSDTPAMFRILDRYLYVLMAQLTRSSACTRFHEIEPRLARWLLMTHDRARVSRGYARGSQKRRLHRGERTAVEEAHPLFPRRDQYLESQRSGGGFLRVL